jgi:mono/diheme cytochrome c family protein
MGLMFLLLLFTLGCQQKMAQQPKYLPLQRSEFFTDSRSARPLEPGTVARGQLRTDTHFFLGQGLSPGRQRMGVAAMVGLSFQNPYLAMMPMVTQSRYVETFPFPVTEQVLQRGQERFIVYCAVCHDTAGYGNGIIVQRGFTRPPTYHQDRLRSAPVGYIYDVVTNGYGSMPDYAAMIPPRDRWAIVAYVRALQLSQYAALKDLPEKERQTALQALGGKP